MEYLFCSPGIVTGGGFVLRCCKCLITIGGFSFNLFDYVSLMSRIVLNVMLVGFNRYLYLILTYCHCQKKYVLLIPTQWSIIESNLESGTVRCAEEIRVQYPPAHQNRQIPMDRDRTLVYYLSSLRFVVSSIKSMHASIRARRHNHRCGRPSPQLRKQQSVHVFPFKARIYLLNC